MCICFTDFANYEQLDGIIQIFYMLLIIHFWMKILNRNSSETPDVRFNSQLIMIKTALLNMSEININK